MGIAGELLIELDRQRREPLRRQLENRLRTAMDDGSLPDGTSLPSSRRLSEQLGVSRGVVVDAYEQLIAQGLLVSQPRRAPVVRTGEVRAPAPRSEPPRPRYPLSPNAPDVGLFPRRAWQRATEEAMRELPDADLDYPPDSRGDPDLRDALAGYLARVRRVRSDLDNLTLTLGFLHSLDILCRMLARSGVRRIAVENPSIPEQVGIAQGHGLQVEYVAVDEAGAVVEELERTAAEAVIVTPAHQFPLGTVLSPHRRRALVAWAAERDAIIVENDYDAEFRYGGPPIGAIQGLAPDRTVYIGTTSKTLAPAVRLGWIVAPAELTSRLGVAGGGGFTGLNAHVFARLLASGAYERHVQRCRREYRRRRDALVAAISAQLPRLRVVGIAGGLHLTLLLPAGSGAEQIADAARSEGLDIRPLSFYSHPPAAHEPGLVMGYGRLPLASVPGVIDVLSASVASS